MAAIHAGVKRSYHDMSGRPGDSRERETYSRSGSQTPLIRSPDLLPIDGRNGTASPKRKASFDSSASIVLVGVRGVGKSTLAVLAATAYSRRLVDTERAFFEATGSTASAYRKSRGTTEYQHRHNQVLKHTLDTHDSGAVIVCSFADLEANGSRLISEYSQSHPVIHVTRDPRGIHSHLGVWPIERIEELLRAGSPRLRSCSNYEFFNLSERQIESTEADVPRPDQKTSASPNRDFLTLKRVERDFIRFLRNIIGDHDRGPAHHSAYPFSRIELENRSYTFAVSLNVSDILSHTPDLDEMQIGADCIELLFGADGLDDQTRLNNTALAFAHVRRVSILPILLNPMSGQHGSQASSKSPFQMTDYCLRLGPEMCAADLSMTDKEIAHIIATKGSTKVVGSLEMKTRPAQGWDDRSCLEQYMRAAKLGCDIVKITMPADNANDMGAIEAFRRIVAALDMAPSLIAYSTGSRGRPSQCFNRILTSVQPQKAGSSAAHRQENECAGVSAKDITQALFATFIFEPLRFFIYGADVSYSLSPAMHNAAYQACGMHYVYGTHSSDNLDDFKKLVRAPDFGGSALTQPYKTMAVALMDELSPHARAIGAVNTILPVRELDVDGRVPEELTTISQRQQRGPAKALYGFNTDWIGIRACIRRGLSPANTIRPKSSALVCGAGGMARSAIYSLISLGVKNIFVCNRTLDRAEKLAEHYNNLITAGGIPELTCKDGPRTRVRVLQSVSTSWPSDVWPATMIVCCVPRQEAGEPPTNFSLPDGWLKSPNGGVVLEVAYRQPVSPLAHQMRSRAQQGWIFMDGFDVLPEQAFSQFELFTGRRAPRKVMREEILKHYPVDEARNRT